MGKTKDKILYGMLSASTGLAGMAALTRCSGVGCSTCFGCAVPGVGILLLSLVNRWRKRKHGMA